MCILYYVGPDKDEFPSKPWIMTSSEGFAKNYASETNGRVFSKELPPRKVILPGEIPEDAKKALKAVEEHTNIMMANRKAGKAGTVTAAECRMAKDQCCTNVRIAPDTNKPLTAGKADSICRDPVNHGFTSSAPDTETPSVFPISELDGLKMQIATLEERIKDMEFELKDKDYTIKELKAKIAGGR